jgi:ubiquinone/menaquinone biosynthesis C-methylase UbiE
MTQREQWQLTSDAAELYERYLVPALFRPWAADLVVLARLRQGDRVLDVACGTGVVARRATDDVGPGGRVVGLDLNAGMLAVARSASAAEERAIEWCESSALSMPFADQSFDVVFCQQGLQFFPDRRAGLQEMHRVLVEGGHLMVSAWRSIEHSPVMLAFAAALEHRIGPGASATLRAPMLLGDAGELGDLLTSAGFREVVIVSAEKSVHYASVAEFLSIRSRTTPPSDPLKQADEGTKEAVLADLSVALTPYVSDSGLTFPYLTHIATGRK